MDAAGIITEHDILFIGDVGEDAAICAASAVCSRRANIARGSRPSSPSTGPRPSVW